jgi:Na+/melibiose symporter-like transporter
VIGIDPRLVSVAILIALIADAFSDPIIGYWSDNFRSRWGRRHPFMYAAAIPVCVVFYLLWAPPQDWSEQALFWYITALAVVVRTLITFYETPSSALVPELAPGYDERSSLLSVRHFFGWTGGNAIIFISFAIIFPLFVTDTISNGQFNPDAYVVYGALASCLIFISITVSTLGTHSRIPHLKLAPPLRDMTLRVIFAEIFDTLSSRSFFALFVAALLAFIGSGFTASLTFYFSTYFWGLGSQQIAAVTLGVFVSAIMGATLAPVVTRRVGKRKGAIIIGLIAIMGSPMPIMLRLLGALPGNESPFIFWFVLVTNTIDVALIICFQILMTSMIADLVEDSELKTGRRSEGLFFAANTFMRKWGEGIGIMFAGFILSTVGLAAGARQGDVEDTTLWLLGVAYVPTVLVLYMAMIVFISRYQIERAIHEDNLRRLAQRENGTPGG